MLPYHLRAQEENSFFSPPSMVLFGFEGDEIQIKLTSLPWNLMSGADSGIFTLQTELLPGARDEQSIPFLCCCSSIRPPSPLDYLCLCTPKSLSFFLGSKCKIIHFPYTRLTKKVPHVRFEAWLSFFDLFSEHR